MPNAKGTEVSAFLVQNEGHIIYSATIVIKRVILLKCAGQWQNQIRETRRLSPFERKILNPWIGLPKICQATIPKPRITHPPFL